MLGANATCPSPPHTRRAWHGGAQTCTTTSPTYQVPYVSPRPMTIPSKRCITVLSMRVCVREETRSPGRASIIGVCLKQMLHVPLQPIHGGPGGAQTCTTRPPTYQVPYVSPRPKTTPKKRCSTVLSMRVCIREETRSPGTASLTGACPEQMLHVPLHPTRGGPGGAQTYTTRSPSSIRFSPAQDDT